MICVLIGILAWSQLVKQPNSQDPPGYLGDTWTFDGTSWTSHTIGVAPSARTDAAFAFDASHGVSVLFGGYPANANSKGLDDTWIWNGNAWSQMHPATSPSARDEAAMFFDTARSVVILFGGWGQAEGGNLNDTWAWNGTTWAQLQPLTSPPATKSQIAYDEQAKVAVLNNGPQTWTWDGSNWIQRDVSPRPVGGADAGMSGGIGGRGVILFGGGECGPNGANFTPAPGDALGPLSTTWSWNGSKWALVSPRGGSANPAFCDPSLVYDSERHTVLAFGGRRDWCETSDETWIWNGSAWTREVLGTQPDARMGMSMAYDLSRRSVVLFGGSRGNCQIANLP